jgi:hypothetical protein
MNKVKKGFYDVLWSMCEKENLLTRWILDGYLGKSKDTFYWTPKALAMFECEVVGEKTIEYPPNELSQVSLEPPKQQKENEKLNEIHNSLEVFIKLFGKQNIGIAGKTTPKITVVKKLLKFFKDYPDYTMQDVIEATNLYIATLKKQGSIRFVRECGYFISKKIDGVDQSDLAKWCEEYKDGGQNYSSHTLL